MPHADVRFIICECCGGDGGGESYPCHFNPVNGDAWGDWIECTRCDRTGMMEVDVEPIEMEDLD